MPKTLDQTLATLPLVSAALASAALSIIFGGAWLFGFAVDSSLLSPAIGGAWLLVSVATLASVTRGMRAPILQTRWLNSAQNALRCVRWQPWLVLFGATLAGLEAFVSWRLASSRQAPTILAVHRSILTSILGLALAFFTLMAERWFASHEADSRQAIIAHMLRVPLLAFVLAAATDSAYAYAQITIKWPMQAATLLVIAVATEFGVRAVLTWFTPRRTKMGMNGLDSTIACFLQWHRAPIAGAREALRVRYGFDLRQNWALRSALRLLPAACAAFVIAGWLLTGVAILAPDQRGVYERFGVPVDVWQPGFHVALPWPFGKVQIVDNGAIREIVVSGDQTSASTSEDLQVRADRLWDVTHEGETTQVVAGAHELSQTFEVVSADIRLTYRTALSDQAARDSLYRTIDTVQTLRVIANREVIRYLASHTLTSLIEERQTAVQDALESSIQRRLDALQSGIELTAVVIEAIHPPAAAASAYHAVQAAQIRAQASIAKAHGQAAEALGMARQDAESAVSAAEADAVETQANAKIDHTDFDADMQGARSDNVGGAAFRFEYMMHSLARGLKDAHMTVIDDRIAGSQQSVIDLRSSSTSSDASNRRGY